MTRATGLAWSLAGLVALAGCSGDTTSPGNVQSPEMSAAEAEFLAVSFDQVSDAAVGDAFATGMVFGPPPAAGSGTWSFTFEHTRPCPVEGDVTVSGSGEITRDRESRTFEMTFESSKTISGCVFQRHDVLYTLNGNADLSVYVLRVDGQLVSAERHHTGSLTVETSDGRSWSCEFALHAIYDGETRSFEVTGTLCDRPIGALWARG